MSELAFFCRAACAQRTGAGLIERKAIRASGNSARTFATNALKSARTLLGRLAGAQIIAAGLEHDHLWLVGDHDAIGIGDGHPRSATRRTRG